MGGYYSDEFHVMRIFFLFIILTLCGCAKNTHTLNHCGGIDIPICEYEVEGEMSAEDQQKVIKHKLMSSLNLIIDQALQNILLGL